MGTYKNVMELLVEEEVIRQYKTFSLPDSSGLKTEDLVACALNQLPALYATTEEGLDYQLQRGRIKYTPQIKQAVQRSIATVRRAAQRPCRPLPQMQTEPMTEPMTAPMTAPMTQVLQQMRQVLKNDELQWETLPAAIAEAVQQTALRPERVSSSRQKEPSGQVTVSSALPHQAIE